MRQAVEIQGPTGPLLVELIPQPEVVSGSTEGMAGVREMAGKLDDAAEAIVQVCLSVREKTLAGLQASHPDSLEVEFGISLAGEAGVPLVTKGTAECTFKVTAKWDTR
jgi:hypothetical protein